MAKSRLYRMRVKENVRMTDPACEDVVVRISLLPREGGTPAFESGQYVRIGIPGVDSPAPAYFAIASDPTQSEGYEFFVKCAGGMANYLCDAQAGVEVEVDGPMGKGFGLDKFHGADVYLIGVGTGIAPLRSVWRYIIAHRKSFGRVAIYAGFMTPMHQLLTEELETLGEHHIEVSVSLEMGHESWDGPIGYVQHAIEADAPDGGNAVACLAGMSAMVDACTKTLQNLGFNESRILLNY
jgi:NAD(P)H-flavin reductase